LTLHNARKIIRLAQCQVEYLLHVQETLVTHKERLRGVAEASQRDAIDARQRSREERSKARAARAELRHARKALKTYEVLEQIRGGKPLDDVLTGAILVAGPPGSDPLHPNASANLSRLSALAEGAEGRDAGLGSPGASPDVVAAKAARRAAEEIEAGRDLELKLQRATEAANALRAEKEAEVKLRVQAEKDAAEALERAMKASEKRAAESAADFERALAKMEARLAEARAEADELRRSAATDAANAKAERERAERLAAEAREKELGELRASVRSVGDGAAVEAATASAELAAAKKRLEDLEQRDGAIIEELRQRLAEKDEECVRLREKRDELEAQLVTIAANASMTPAELLTPGRASPNRLSPSRTLSLSRRSGERFAEELRASLEPVVNPDASGESSLRIQEELREAREEMAKAKAAAEEAKAAKEEVERLRLSMASDEAKAAREEVERLKKERDQEMERLNAERAADIERLKEEREREIDRLKREREEELKKIRAAGVIEIEGLRKANTQLTASADAERQKAEKAKRAELEARERAMREAEEQSKKVAAASAALEAERARRALEDELAAQKRKTSPERKAASDVVAAELKLLRESITASQSPIASPSKGPANAAAKRSDEEEEKETPDFSVAPSTAVTASAEPESRVQESAREEDARRSLEERAAPLAEPTVTEVVGSDEKKAGASASVDEEEKKKIEEEKKKIEEEDDDVIEGEVIVHEDVPDEAARPQITPPAPEPTEAPTPGPSEAPAAQPSAAPEPAAPGASEAPPAPDPPPPLPVIPPARTISEVSDEPEPMSPSAVDDVIAAEAKRLAEAKRVADAEAEALRREVEAAEKAAAASKRADASGSGPGPSSDPEEPAHLSAARSKLEEMTRKAKANAAEAARAVAKAASTAPPLTDEQREAWLAKHPHQPIPRAPFALSRFASHDPDLFDAAEEAVVAYLEEQVMEQLTEFGVPETATALDDVRYVEMMAELRASRKEKLGDLGEEERRKYELERAAILDHIAATSRSIMASRGDDPRAELFPSAATIKEAVPRVMGGASPRDSLDTAALAEAMRNDPENPEKAA